MRTHLTFCALLALSLTACGGDQDENRPGGASDKDPLAATDSAAGLRYCASVLDWDSEWVEFEHEVLVLSNEARAAGHDCDTEGNFDPAPPLQASNRLACAARLHSVDMIERQFFDHNNPDGEGPAERVSSTGYEWVLVGENIAAGYRTPQEVVDGWLDSDGHCRNLMDPDFEQLGVGYYYDSSDPFRYYWTQNFGTLR